jgi:pilus assembly protein CpaC
VLRRSLEAAEQQSGKMMNQQKKHQGRRSLLTVTVVAFLLAFQAGAPVQAQTASDSVTLGYGNTESLLVPLFKSRVIRLNSPAARVSVGNPDVADILILRATQLYVLGKDLGTTNVLLWDRDDNLVGTVAVEVSHDLESLKAKLHELLPNERVEAFSAQRSIVLRGNVSSITSMDTALQIARGYLAQIQTGTEATEFEQQDSSRREDKTVGAVINLMHIGGAQQVMLEVKVAEIQRTELKRIQAQFNALSTRSSRWSWGGVNGGAAFPDVVFPAQGGLPAGRIPVLGGIAPWGPAITEFAPNTQTIGNQGVFGSFLSDTFLFNLAIDAAREKGLARILAEPTLTTLTGQEARFLSGGEFGFVVQGGIQGNTVEFKEFGIGLGFLPVILGSGVINVKLNVAVSDLIDSPNPLIPALLTKRSADSTVELREGQTMAIAGLISESTRSAVEKFPGLGDLPVLGQLFSSQSFRNDETELVILVTPHLAQPLDPRNIRLPTDRYVKPTDLEFYLLGRIEGRASSRTATQAPGGTDAQYGHRVD